MPTAKPGKTTTEPTEPKKERLAPDRMLFTKAKLDKLLTTRPHRQRTIWDVTSRSTGLSVLVSRGPKHKRQATVTFRVVYYLPDKPGEPRYKALGRYPDECSDIDAVRRKAAKLRGDAADGIDPKRRKLSGNFKEIVDQFFDEYARHKRTGEETLRILSTYVVPEWAEKNIETITKSDVSALMNKIGNGRIAGPDGSKIGTPFVARAVRTQLVTLFNWYVANYSSDDFRSPIVKPQKNDPVLKKPKARERYLNDNELRALWTASGEMDVYGAAIRTALLTAVRFGKVKQMRRRDLKARMPIAGWMENGQWIEPRDIPHVWDPSRPDDPPNKQVAAVPLSKLARDVIAAVPIIDAKGGKDFVFSINGRGPLDNWDRKKKKLDDRMTALLREDDPNAVLEPWQARDLRRTARTLLSRAGISREEVKEHSLGHVGAEIKRTYDRHGFLAEKAAAFEALAQLIARIVNPPAVVPLRGEGAATAAP